MKNLVLTLFLLCAVSLHSQNVEMQVAPDSTAFYEVIVECKGGKDTLYTRAKNWVFETYKSGKSVIQNEDREAAQLIAKGITKKTILRRALWSDEQQSFEYSFSIKAKDGRVKLRIESIKYKSQPSPKWGPMPEGADLNETYPSNWMTKMGEKKVNTPNWREATAAAKIELSAICLSFIAAMKNEKEGDW